MNRHADLLENPSAIQAPKGVRGVLANGLLAGLVLSHLAAIALDRESWPVSQYPMYASRFTNQLTRIGVFGVIETGQEVPLFRDEYWVPIGGYTLSVALSRMKNEEERRRALRYLRARYAQRRVAGEHRGPKLRSLRVYRAQWRVRPDASNAARPEQMELMAGLEERLGSLRP